MKGRPLTPPLTLLAPPFPPGPQVSHSPLPSSTRLRPACTAAPQPIFLPCCSRTGLGRALGLILGVSQGHTPTSFSSLSACNPPRPCASASAGHLLFLLFVLAPHSSRRDLPDLPSLACVPLLSSLLIASSPISLYYMISLLLGVRILSEITNNHDRND